ncbi:MAG: tryptophan-rich sensory protein [Sphingobacterium sp.]|nr:tryptophan-rich sensory protein [Sphingobacterium sp.]
MIRYVNLVFFAGMIVMNYLANALPLNGRTTGEISSAYPNLFTPAGVTFSIWGVIYLLLAGYCIVQLSDKGLPIAKGVGWLFAVSCLLNALWIMAWHYEKVPLSLVIMAGLLVTLILINMKLKDRPLGLTKAAFGVYLGWICIATIANVTTLLVRSNWNGFGISQEIWAILMIAVGAAIVSVAIVKLANPFLGLAVVWAFAGIILKRSQDYLSIVVAAAAGILIVAVVTVRAFLRR